MNFKTRKITASIVAVLDVFLAFFLHNTDYGIFILVSSVLALSIVCFKFFFARYGSSGIFYKNPTLVELTGWVFLFAILFYDIIAVNK